jgi:hypothetical protein
MKAHRPGLTVALSAALAAGTYAQQGPAQGQAPAGEVILTASSANVAEPGNAVTFRILRWSTDEERAALTAALNPASVPAAAAAPGGAARGGRAAGRGGRGRGRGDAGDTAPPSPTAMLTAAIGRAPTVGYIWTNDVTGYSIKYAWRAALPDGSERIIVATDRRFGAHSAAWTPVPPTPAGAAAAPTDYEFTLIEMRLEPKGAGDGKTSHMTRVIADTAAGTVALENYAGTAAMLRNVKAGRHGAPPDSARGAARRAPAR